MNPRLLCLLFPMLVVSACGDILDAIVEDDKQPSYNLSYSPTSLSFQADGGEQDITVSTDAPHWWAEKTGDWLSGSYGEGAIIVTAQKNTLSEERSGTIYIRLSEDGDKVLRSVEIPVRQAAGSGASSAKVTIGKEGGELNVGGFSLSVPGGALDSSMEIEVRKLPQNSIREGEEVSDFFTVTLPVNTTAPLTVSISSENLGGDVDFIAHSPTAGMHDFQEGYSDVNLDAKYANGSYTVTLPAFENGSETGTLAMSLGLVRRIGTKAETKADVSIKADVTWVRRLHFSLELDEMIKKYADQAIAKFVSLGFTFSEDRTIPINLCYNSDEGEWGGFRQSYVTDTWSVVELNDSKLAKSPESQVAKTVYHEIFHYFQAEMDPRWPATKARNVYRDLLMLHEAGGAWAEKFVFNETNYSDVMEENIYAFFRSLEPEDELYPGVVKKGIFVDKLKKDIKYQPHGYGLASLLMYLTGKYGDDKIHLLYEQEKNGATTTRKCLEQFAKALESNLFSFGYPDFIDELALKKVAPELDLLTLSRQSELNKDNLYDFTLLDSSHSFNNKHYPYGASICMVKLQGFSETLLEDARLTAELKDSGLLTFVYKRGRGANAPYEQLCSIISNDGEVTLLEGGKALDQVLALFFVTVNISNYAPVQGELTVSLKKEEDAYLEVRTGELEQRMGFYDMGPNGGSQRISYTSDQPFVTVSTDADWLTASLEEEETWYGYNSTYIVLTAPAIGGDKARSATVTVSAGTSSQPDKVQKTFTVRQSLKYEGMFLGWWASDNSLSKTLTLGSNGGMEKLFGGGNDIEYGGQYWVLSYQESGGYFSGTIQEWDGNVVSFSGRKTSERGKEMTYQGVALANYYDNGM